MITENFRFVIALDCEALPIIEFYNLDVYKETDGIFKCYKNSTNTIWLIISGIGNINSAAATIYLKKVSLSNKNSIWINLGTGGHYNLKPGNIYHIKAVTPSNNLNDVLYSNAVINNIIKNYEVYNVTNEERQFNFKDKIYEMEAYGFLKTTEKFTFRELTCVLKVISDNSEYKPKDFNKFAANIINSNLYLVDKLLRKFLTLSNKIEKPNDKLASEVFKKFQLSFSNKVKVSKLINKVEYILGEEKLRQILFTQNKQEDLIKELENVIKTYSLNLKHEKDHLHRKKHRKF